ncbi:MAG: CBS domain-containing protein [Microcoleus sp. PH2017_10_PVI_O_A]|uniref:CBS domain-containing protein n=1 Tax=unclassified Microcoleus TaxID=2642155 RepID=UPI001E02D494|nr:MULTISPECIES: CBS domain-containing protein [unclassified Microcoleus]TAE81025.1 MAG: CBS domain-containing protein [Oscillatoriales cyanobacterium]MCC3407322.1 CBS domain-containing protein [Microcoleus sp. PH2017_10_PVI_O_A]MCC3461378.1 CBS domain-containing protein [Microcoleus sp. PH2017_11_PCY_U_A]MCC3479853.1 CBS domain-containing protein [Microcoleus sp. PH2017_12_PCY_D_A]MCC3528547.1 CBS domain-containing protein [Microcoleus sp. PH2017_21_RUC_O_A]
MPFYHPPFYSSALEQAIDRYPLTAGPETSLAVAIALMSQLQNSCPLVKGPLSSDKGAMSESAAPDKVRARCVLVVQNQQTITTGNLSENPSRGLLIGILTPADLVRLIASGKINSLQKVALHKIPIAEVMSPVSVSLTESDDQDVFTALSLFRQHRIRYLPIVNQFRHLVGVLTRERIRQVLQPSNILKLRRVAELMTTPITAPHTASLLSISELMSEHQVSCVVITKNKELTMEKPKEDSTSVFHYSFHQPLGIVTEYDIVQAQYLELNFEQTPAQKVMRTPLQFLEPSDSLWTAHKQMQQQQVQRLVVCGGRGELLGIITQTSLLRVLDPTEMYRVVKQLQQSVYQLQSEKLELLQSRNAKLEQQVRERTAKLHEQVQRDRLLTQISFRIHQSLNLNEILHASVDEVRQVLQADRVAIVRWESSNCGIFVAESVAPNWSSILGEMMPDNIWQEDAFAIEQEIYAVPDIDKASLSAEKYARFQQAQIKAYLIVPILQDGNLWGMMCVHQCSKPRKWQASELDLLLQLATQIAIAIQQAQLYQQVQNLNTDLERQVQERTAQLEQKVQELQHLNILKDEFLSTVSHELRTPLSNMKMAIHMLRISPTPDRRQIYLEILETECTRETDLINALLDLQRLEAATCPIDLEPVNLAVWLPTIIDPFYTRAQNRHQHLRVECDRQLPTISSNRASLGRILAELLNNACKYTANDGEISLKVECIKGDGEKEGSGKNSAQASVRASEIQFTFSNQSSIAIEELPRIFDKFYRVPNADPWKQGGTGLGLALVQKLVEQLQGKIEVESSKGWTNFTVTFPTKPDTN